MSSPPRPLPERTDPVRRVLGLLIGGAGVLDLVSALAAPMPHRIRSLQRLVPFAVPHVANVLVVLSGLLLIFLARQLIRGKHRAWQAAVALLIADVGLHLFKGLDIEEASAAAVLAIGLIVARKRFRAVSDAPSIARLIRLGPMLVAFPFVYGMAGLYLRRGRVLGAFSLRSAALEVLNRMVGLDGPLRYAGRFGRWYPASITALSALSAVYILFLAFRPVVHRSYHRTPDEDQRLRALLANDHDTLSYFLLRDDKALFFSSDERAALGYRVVGGVALISGDPAGPMDAWPEILREFTSFAHERGWRVAALGVGEEAGPVWEASGYRVLYIGDEAVVDPSRFSLEGRAIRKVRQDCTRLERNGYSIEFHRADDVHPDLRRALRHISEAWKGGDEERGFTMTLGRVCDRRDPDCLIAVARDGEGNARGFLHFVPIAPGGESRGYSLDVMRRDRDTPTGLNEYLIARTLEYLRDEGVRTVSLNFAFLRGIIRPAGRLSIGQRIQAWIANTLGPWFQIESLYRFNNKFEPAWVPRYAAYEDALAVPSVFLAVMRAEGLLDLSLLRKGQGGKRAAKRETVPA